MTETQRSGPRHHAKAAPIRTSVQRTADTPEGYTLPCGRAHACPPVPGRRLWLAVVLTCPQCGSAHAHRTGEAARLLSGRIVRTCPTTGRTYTLNPVQRRREARRRAA